ncbi:hypothetical protein SAMN05880501_10554 [Ureibacillus xyleni]|uniref:RNase H type-1 domain-containing protein n=1 Tax=Ureibacillus xyleni TaxID=614648 RepID=A0A285SQH9_9BACL|nr:hypothetical protein [Ureibacillus xyleni]SOC08289.1 hypothetical protein SAMN05880501_10554 [Ureibacillus xyleni]
MKSKGIVKRVKKPSFWGNHEEKVPLELKEWVLNQYFSQGWLYIYCDSSCSKLNHGMSVACTYVGNGSVMVTQQLVYSPADVCGKNVFGELKSVIFALLNFSKYIETAHKGVTIYSDLDDIEMLLSKQIVFKKIDTLKTVQNELIDLFVKMQTENPELTIEVKYLTRQFKKHNPFMKASHNASRRLLKRS